ncbi:16S rRNA (guanine(966)-N(2))-methyltransferase RsmD [Pseudoalteromonas xiamenensis]|uniref:Ribosomal RNA small subunit methyltransferase D n=1 Tax=Pseudoalteromonas xiamenensis TaxID=882626 RepID=A0A975DFE4_9GAMM|nr:16S rRNA (guanine(966)-N(2))-methyltransferase RsmD [Pseudoalteromonas xiamenensis]QTH70773.1 16S rRNA (guanine(966)-N(2))-methyltransferase RsmD [Pseudoalteromonas xiamenensis]
MRKNTPSASSKNGFIRIIGGKYRGRKLPVKDVEGLRPTTDRVKETLFNWLMQDVRDATVLDCFAGSGGLGFEALSRFAATVTFIERDKSAAQQIEANMAAVKATNARVLQSDALTTTQTQATQQYDIVFVDPPFRKALAAKICTQLETNGWLAKEAIIYIEVEQELELNVPENWRLYKEKKAGQVAYRLFLRE